MERKIREVTIKKVRIEEGFAKPDFRISVNDILKVMRKRETIRFDREEWSASTVVTTVSRANAMARMRKEIELNQSKYKASNDSLKPYVEVTRNR